MKSTKATRARVANVMGEWHHKITVRVGRGNLSRECKGGRGSEEQRRRPQRRLLPVLLLLTPLHMHTCIHACVNHVLHISTVIHTSAIFSISTTGCQSDCERAFHALAPATGSMHSELRHNEVHCRVGNPDRPSGISVAVAFDPAALAGLLGANASKLRTSSRKNVGVVVAAWAALGKAVSIDISQLALWFHFR